MNIVARLLLVLYLVMWIGGVVSYAWRGGLQAHETWAPTIFLFLAALIVLLTSTSRTRWALLVAASFGLIAEVLGVHTGVPFGRYEYTDALPPRVLDVPVVMAAAWLVLVAYVGEMLRHARWPWIVSALVSATWLTAIDLVIDPVAAGPLEYWRWREGGRYFGVPAQNFLGWSIVGAAIFVSLHSLRRWPPAPNSTARWIGLSIIAFFSVLAAVAGLLPVALVGFLLGVVHFVVSQRLRSV